MVKKLEKANDSCVADGHYINLEEIDIEKIRSLFNIAKQGKVAALKLINDDRIGKEVVFRILYDSLRELTDAFIRFDRIKSRSHKCLFAYISFNNPGLKLDWSFLEMLRVKKWCQLLWNPDRGRVLVQVKR